MHKHPVSYAGLTAGTLLYEISMMKATNILGGEWTGLQEQLWDKIKFIFSQQRKTNFLLVIIKVPMLSL